MDDADDGDDGHGSDGVIRSIFAVPAMRKTGMLVGIGALLAVMLILVRAHVAGRPEFAVSLAEPAEIQEHGEITWASGGAAELIRRSVAATVSAALNPASPDEEASRQARTSLAQIDPLLASTHPSDAPTNEPTAAVISIFDDTVVPRVHDAFAASPWIREVDLVTRRYPNTLVVRYSITQPALAPVHNGRSYLVDDRGLVLPLVFPAGEFEAFNHECAPRLMQVTGLPAPPRPGEQAGDATGPATATWTGEGMRAALAMWNLLHDHVIREHVDIEAIDVGNVGGAVDTRDSEVTLTVRAHLPSGGVGRVVTVLWGRDPGRAGYGENTADTKLAMLKSQLALDPALTGVSRLDLRWSMTGYDRVYDAAPRR